MLNGTRVFYLRVEAEYRKWSCKIDRSSLSLSLSLSLCRVVHNFEESFRENARSEWLVVSLGKSSGFQKRIIISSQLSRSSLPRLRESSLALGKHVATGELLRDRSPVSRPVEKVNQNWVLVGRPGVSMQPRSIFTHFAFFSCSRR